ncbi:MAG: response regulator [Propionivibrio sp.]
MSSSFKVYVVDDDPVVLDIMHAILEPDCEVETFPSAEDCLMLLESEKPDFFLLDVNLPGMDGYTLCRRIKDDPALRDIPVTFVSSYDTIEERITGYDAGGEDFIVKPFEPEELLRKLLVAQSMIASQRSLVFQAEEAELLSSLVMANMDETGILLQFMSKLIAMESADEIAAGLLELLQRYRLDGVVQTRVGGRTQTTSGNGNDHPLETAVIEHVRDQGRIFEFRQRSVHNFERVTLMINNLPLDDPDYCGRLRDHLSVAVQSVNSRLKALEAETTLHKAQSGVRGALDSVSETIRELHRVQTENTLASSKLTQDLQQTLLDSFYRLGLTDNQEKFLQDMVGDFITRMSSLLNRGTEAQETLHRLSSRLEQLRGS